MLNTSAPDAPGIAIWLENTPASIPPQREFAVKGKMSENECACMMGGLAFERQYFGRKAEEHNS